MKLTYFDVKGLAETSRFLLAIGGEDYEDFRYPLNVIDMSKHEMVKEEFDNDKNEGNLVKSLNKVPFLEVDGVVIPQSKAIERFLARRFNMMGDSEIESAQIDSICECVRDFKDMYQKVRALPENEKSDGMNEWFTVTLVERLGLLENLLSDCCCSDRKEGSVPGCGYSVGNKLSLADVVLYCFITQFFDNKEASYNATLAAPRLRKVVDSVSKNEKVIDWLNKRPQTLF
jgi:prostaglandin-H2 D-isomerase / glutathione transferase